MGKLKKFVCLAIQSPGHITAEATPLHVNIKLLSGPETLLALYCGNLCMTPSYFSYGHPTSTSV